ncbi:MAG: hypothetical protein EBT80_09355 [Chitinophagales bacterium]|nr:hypothetical protein [Chitinophagales bacterium]
MAVGFDSVRSTTPRPLADSWDALVEVLSVHAVRERKQDGNLWSPVTYAPGARRGLAGVETVECFVLDLDDVPLDAVCERLRGLAYVAYSTWSFAGTSGVHVVVPLAEPCDAWEWESVWDACFERFGSVGDSACRDASRIYYRPQRAEGAPSFVEVGEGDHLDVSSLSVSRPRWRERSRRARGTVTSKRDTTTPYFLSEEWWNEPQDLSRFEGKSKQEVAQLLLEEFQDLRRILREIEADADAKV